MRFQTDRSRYLAVFALAAIPRVLYLAIARPPFELYHWTVADALVQHGYIGDEAGPSTQFDPLYPVFLAIGRFAFGDRPVAIQFLQIGVDSLGAVALYRLTAYLTGVQRTALLAAALYGAYPLLIRHAVVGDDGALLSVLLIAFACAAVSGRSAPGAAFAGIWIGLAVLTRAAVAPVALFATIVFAATRAPATALAFSMAVTAVISPWVVRNYTTNGALWPSRAGENLLHGNSTYTAALLPEHNLDALGEHYRRLVAERRPDLLERSAEASLDRYFGTLAWQDITARPGQAVKLGVAKAAYFFWPRLVPARIWTPDTHVTPLGNGRMRVDNSPSRPTHEQVVYMASYGLIAAAALAGIWRRRTILEQDVFLWCIVGSFVSIAVIFFPATRLRVPMEFVLLFYAAVALDALLPRERLRGFDA
jgi:hypothetical protein